ncbi:MAG: ATPase [Firmicutes bacterium]|nr:ATPase [Bacillota bacterium]
MAGKFLGIDGGGSTIRALLVDEGGAVLRYQQAGAANVLVVGPEAAQRAWEALGMSTERCTAVVAGLAGADRPWVREYWQRLLGPLAPRVAVVGDYEIAWAALTEGRPGCLAILGTGSIVYGRHGTRKVRLGGYGWRVGDVGSGMRLGTEAVRSALAHLDGSGPFTQLTESVLRWSDCTSAFALLDFLYDPAMDWRRVAELAHSVFQAASQGDEVAAAILHREGEDILRMLSRCLAMLTLPEEAPVGVAGGLAPFWLTWLSDAWDRITGRVLRLVERPPVEGAALWARRMAEKTAEGESLDE